VEVKLQHSSEKESLWGEIHSLTRQVQTLQEERRTSRDDEVGKLRAGLVESIGKNKELLNDFDDALSQRADMEVQSSDRATAPVKPKVEGVVDTLALTRRRSSTCARPTAGLSAPGQVSPNSTAVLLACMRRLLPAEIVS
jgi:hypothetical protein